MNKFLIVVASNDEKKALIPTTLWHRTYISGYGIINTIRTLRYLQAENPYTFIINVGYAGSKGIDVGTICKVKDCKMYQETEFGTGTLSCRQIRANIPEYNCYTGSDFVTSSSIECPFLVDMELAAYTLLNYPVISIKVVSDNLEVDNYFEALKDNYSEEIGKILTSIEEEL